MIQTMDPILLVAGLLLLSLAPFLIMVCTSYLKIVVVLSLVRNALGVQQIPPTTVLNGLAIIFTFFIMAPVGIETFQLLEKKEISRETNIVQIWHIVQDVKKPFQNFLIKHSDPKTTYFFLETAKRIWPAEAAKNLKNTDFSILIPSFAVSELTRAFQMGFLLYLPFVTLDIIFSNILLAMGMMMVSPTTISLPFKLLIFVLVDGWALLVQGLILSYK